MIDINDVADFYTYFYSKKYGSEKYRLQYTDWSLKIAKYFIGLFNTHYTNPDRRMLWNYCVFQFDNREGQKIVGANGDGKILFNMIFEEKPFFCFYSRDINFDYIFYKSEILKKYKLKFNDVPDKNAIKVNKGFDYEEILKEKFKKEGLMLLNCLEFTTLYKPDSQLCTECKDQKQCKIILNDNFPDLYKARIEKQ